METIGGMGTSYRRNDFWVRLGGQTVVMIGRWCLRQPLTNHKKGLSTQTIPSVFPPSLKMEEIYDSPKITCRRG